MLEGSLSQQYVRCDTDFLLYQSGACLTRYSAATYGVILHLCACVIGQTYVTNLNIVHTKTEAETLTQLYIRIDTVHILNNFKLTFPIY